ncbi:HNH endonuclease signature motif containing protein [Arthrobacter zhaoguopingii]|uniref:HNH endonuclease signature motif containing protein n=1 Tax=Arthrobacter zhaoguopingii TaxID=2681491 RepID=UPI00135942F9|nr:HNH endonuclease signature motif containing protein [Arthrobacter zhaoguopingii]
MVQPAPETKADEAFDPEWTAPSSTLEDGLFSYLENEPLWLAHELTALDPAAIAELNAGEAVGTLEKVARLERWLSALKAQIVHRVGTSMTERAPSGVEHRLASMNAVSETACVLNIPEGTAGFLLNESTALVEDFPTSLEALSSGTINYQHAQVIIRESTGIPADERAGYEESLLRVAPDLTRPQLAVRARRLREKMCPEAAAERRTKAEADRAVWLEPAPDGMAYLSAFLGAETAVAMFDRLTRAARAAQGPNEARTLAQLRADALAGLVIQDNPSLQEEGILSGIRPQVLVTVPVLSLLGESKMPGDLEGYGPIPASIARKLAANAPSLLRLLTDPVDSAVLDVGRRRYRVPTDLKTYLRARDKTCRYPGCNRSAATADLDHTVPWEDGGSTRPGNLACLCPKHHRMKHEAGWSVRQHPGGVLAWTSPTGRNYSTRPEDPPAAVHPDAGQASASARVSGRTPGSAWHPPPAEDPPPF